MREINWRTYLIAFLITLAIFFSAIFLSNYLSAKRVEEVKSIEDRISTDILNSEINFSLLRESSCENVDNSVLSRELNNLARRLSYMENRFGVENKEVLKLKKYYSLLQIKDYLLMKEISDKCDLEPIFILYFYSNLGDCDECVKEGYVLTRLREKYPQLRIYSFDFNLDLSTIKTLISINKVENKLPALVINGEIYYGFNNVDEIEKILPTLKDMEEVDTKEGENIDI